MGIGELAARSSELAVLQRAIHERTNLLLVGDPGVGKSYLGRSAIATLDPLDWFVCTIAGSPAVKTVHLGAVQPLATPGMARTPDEMFVNIQTDLRRQANDRTSLLFVDDIDLIDPASAALLEHLARSNTLVVATVRSESANKPSVLALWKDALFERVDLDAFDEAGSGALIEVLLEGPASQQLQRSVFDLAAGNALFTRELVADGQASGSIVHRPQSWELVGELRSAQRVSDLFTARLDALATDKREAVESIALADTLTVSLAQELLGPALLEDLEGDGLIIVADGMVRAAHPLLGEVVQQEIPSLRKERLVGELIEAVLGSPTKTPDDVLRSVRWQLERNQDVQPEFAAIAAQTALAIFDGPTAVRCAEAALTPESSSSYAILGRALLIAQRPDEAVDALIRAQQLATTEAETAVAAVSLSDAMIVATGDFQRVADLLEQALSGLQQPQARAMVSSSLAYTQALMGELRTAMRYSDKMIESSEVDDFVRLHLLVIWTIAATLSGWTEKTQARLDQAIELATAHRSVLPAALDQLLVTQVMHDVADGRMAKAVALALEQRSIAEREHRLTALWDLTLSQESAVVGNASFSLRTGAAAVAGHKLSDPLGLSPFSLAVHATAFAFGGDVGQAMALHDAALADPRCGPREHVHLARTRSNVLAIEGDLDGAVQSAVDGASKAGDLFVWASFALYDAVRFHRPIDVAAQLRSVADLAPVETVLALNQHCEALVAADAVQLTKAAHRLTAAGFTLFAAEAWAHASLQLTIDGDATGSNVAALRSLLLFDQCDEMQSLAVEELTNPLTARELDVAKAAAAGQASQSIAEENFVSRRTVDNHLHNVYRKLGINQRSELEPIFAVPPPLF